MGSMLREALRRRRWLLLSFLCALAALAALVFLLGGSYVMPEVYRDF